jgi:hypothetical protein
MYTHVSKCKNNKIKGERKNKIKWRSYSGGKKKKEHYKARHQWLMPVNLATQEAEIRRIMVQSQPRQIVHKILS